MVEHLTNKTFEYALQNCRFSKEYGKSVITVVEYKTAGSFVARITLEGYMLNFWVHHVKYGRKGIVEKTNSMSEEFFFFLQRDRKLFLKIPTHLHFCNRDSFARLSITTTHVNSTKRTYKR